jgi:hypothetical protein
MRVFNLVTPLELSNHNAWVNVESGREADNALFRIQRSDTGNEALKLCVWNEKLCREAISLLL